MQESELNQLITLCKEQHKNSFKKLFIFIQPKIFLICKRYLSNCEDRYDVLQEVSIKIYTKIHQFEDQKGKFEAWVYQITKNECFKFLQQKHIQQEILTENESFYSISQTEQKQNIIYEMLPIYQTIEKLKKGQKTILKLYLIEGYNHEEIASILNISINTSKSQLSRAKDRLQELMLKEYPNMVEYL